MGNFHSWKSWADNLGNLVFPPKCHGCAILLQDTVNPFCQTCVESIPGRGLKRCYRCGIPRPDQTAIHSDSHVIVCPICVNKPPIWESVVSLGTYEGTLREWILKQKGRGGQWFAEILGRFWANNLAKNLPPWDKVDAVVPVPRHWTKKWWLGHNPAEGLSRGLCGLRDWPLDRFSLFRTRATRKQSELTPNQRKSNVRGAFAWRGRQVMGGKAILVDDIITTGATLKECAKILKSVGFTQITLFVLAQGKTLTTNPVEPG